LTKSVVCEYVVDINRNINLCCLALLFQTVKLCILYSGVDLSKE